MVSAAKQTSLKYQHIARLNKIYNSAPVMPMVTASFVNLFVRFKKIIAHSSQKIFSLKSMSLILISIENTFGTLRLLLCKLKTLIVSFISGLIQVSLRNQVKLILVIYTWKVKIMDSMKKYLSTFNQKVNGLIIAQEIQSTMLHLSIELLLEENS
jgi:hypothetical protein